MPKKAIPVDVLRESFRNLHAFRVAYETDQVDVLEGPGGIEICLWDLEYLYQQIESVLSPRQHQAIELFLVQGHTEETVAEMMGLAQGSPVGMYATAGLKKLIRLVDEGRFPRFRWGYSWQS